MKRTIHLVSECGDYFESDWHDYLLSDFDVVHHDDPDEEYLGENAILVISTSGVGQGEERIRQQLRRFKEAGLKVGLIHLSDEWQQAAVDFYGDAAFVFRNYYRSEAQREGHIRYFALGWKAGFRDALVTRPIQQRRHTWSFAGQMKTSREAMLRAAERVPEGRVVKAPGFGGEGGLTTREYAAMLNDTVFALCPRGNHSVDCFRVYEAMEAGAIPIVEDDAGWDLLGEWLYPWNFMRIGGWRRSYWRYHFRNPLKSSFWKTAYGRDFPCPRIINWATLDRLLRSIDIKKTAAKVQQWWAGYKESLRKEMRETVEGAFFGVSVSAKAVSC